MARRDKEQKELQRRIKEYEKPVTGKYLWFLMIVLAIVYIVDEVTSNLPSSLQSEVVEEFFVRGMDMDLTTGVAALTGMMAPFYAMLGLGTAFATVSVSVISVFLSHIPLGWLWFAACVPFMAIAILILIFKVHETKDNDINTITGSEWD